MSAPWGVELDQDILLVVHDNLLVVLGDDDSDWAIVGLWDRLALDGRLDLARDKVGHELLNVLGVDLLILREGELLVLVDLLDRESGPLANLEVEVACVLTEGLGVDSGEGDLALVLLSDRLELLSKVVTLGSLLGEDVSEGNASLIVVSSIVSMFICSSTYAHVASVGLRTNLADERRRGGRDEAGDSFGLELLRIDVLALIEALVQDNTWLLDTILLSERRVVGGTEEVAVTESLSDRCEGSVGGFVVGTEVANDNDLVLLLEVLDGLGVDDGYGRHRLLGHV